MAKKKPWWVTVKGGQNAIRGMANFNVQPALRDAWMVQNRTRLNENPELAAAVNTAGVPYSVARRIDLAFQATKAKKQQDIETQAGRTPAMQDPTRSLPAYAQARTEAQKPKEEEGGGFWGWLTGTGQKPIIGQEASLELGHNISSNKGDVPLWQQPLNVAWDLGKGAVEGVSYGLNAALSPIAGPIAAGSADQQARGRAGDANLFERLVIPGAGGTTPGEDFLRGVGNIVEGVDSQQAQDMRKAGYNPDSWSDRYAWYGDFSADNRIVSNRAVGDLKREFNPYKVDLAREVLTIGALDDPKKINGLSEDAQRFLSDIQSGKDKDGNQIFSVLADRSAVTMGGHVADALGLSLGTTERQVVGAVADLAAYWFVDPTIVAGKALTAFRDARYAVAFDPQEIKEALVVKGAVAARWDDVLDRIDNIHVLSQTKTVEAQAQVAKEFTRFQQAHPDIMPFYDTLLGMRQGSIQGTFFKAPQGTERFRDIADFNPIGITRVDDPAKYKPIFELRQAPGQKVDDATRDTARAEIADRIGDAIYANAILTGAPLVKGQILMPGQLRVSNVVRVPLQRLTDKLLGQDKKLLRQLREAEGKGLIDFTAHSPSGAVAGVLDSAKGGQWVRENYTRGGLRDRAAIAASRFAVSKDAPVLHIDGMDSVKTFHDFARFFMPRGHAAFMANTWAKADPAQRSVMLNSVMETLANARHMKDGQVGIDFWRQQLKGREAPILPGERVKEAYSSPDMDLIQTPSGPTAAAMYSTQFANGVQLPSYQEILRNTEKIGPLSWLAGLSHSRGVSNFTRITKVGQVGTTSNMLRQNIEGRSLQFIDDPLGATHAAIARLGLAGGNAAARAAANEAVRQARQISKSGEADKLVPLLATQKFDDYADAAAKILQAKGKTITPELDAFLRQGAPIDRVAKGRSAARLAVTGTVVDPLRKARAKLYSRVTAKTDEPFSYEWIDRVDDGFTDRLIDGTHTILGGNRAHYMDGGMVDELDQVAEGVAAGQRLAQIKLKNTAGYLGAAGDSGALRWNNALGLRLADPVGGQVMQALARKVLGKKTEEPIDLARRLLTTDPAGEAYRLNGRRGQYLNGVYVGGTVDQTAALRGWGDQMVQDALRYLGLESSGIVAGGVNAAHKAFLGKIANGKQVSPDDLAKIDVSFRPEQVHSPVVVGKKFLEVDGMKMTDKVADGASKMYQFVVANPLRRMLHDPQVVAAHSEAMMDMEPLARALAGKGMTADNIYRTLDTMAYGHAIQRVARYSDNPHVTSYFAALSNNFLWYERAMEDFARRIMRITKADPAKVVRAALTIEAAHHSGLIYDKKTRDDDGNTKTETMFTWPGSGWAMRTLNEAARSLGLADDDVVTIPVWENWASPVKYLSPSAQNPIGFTSSPLIGMPLRITKAIFPELTPSIESALTTLEGGERHFGSSNALESLLPVYARRVWNALDRTEQDSQYASAMRNALIHLEAAGRLPASDAPDIDRLRARDEVRQMVVNNLVWRTAFAMFAPATPGTMTGNISGIGDEAVDEIDRLRGVTNIRGEWFQLLEDMNARFPNDSNQAFSEATIEWARRDLGSIVNPAVFAVGSSGAPGTETGKSSPSNLPTTQWMLDNREFLKGYGQAAYSLIPSMGDTYYNQIGYQVQLRTELRQHKDLKEFYEDLVIAQANSDFYNRLTQRTQALAATKNKDEQQKVYNEWNSYVAELKRANPVWAEQFNAQKDPDYISANIAPAVARMAEDENVPAEVKPLRPQLKQMAKLYDDYRTAQGKYPGTRYQDIQARKQISQRYNNRGNELFKGGPLEPLWKSMQVFED